MANVSSSNGLEKRPKLRFPGFDEPYRAVKLGQISSLIKRNDPRSNAPIMMLSAGNGFIMQSDKYSRDNAGQSLKKYTLLKKGELAYNHGASKAKQFGCCYELREEEARIPYVYHCFKVQDTEYTPYVALELNNTKMDKQLKRLVSSSVRMDGLLNISYDEYMSVVVYLPAYAEQKHIADFLEKLDMRIAKQEQLIESLKKYKRGAVRSLLSEKSCSLKNASWTTAKMGELGCFIKGAPLSKADISEDGTPFILYGELYTTYNEVITSVKRRTQAQVDEIFLSRVGDVVIPTSGETPEEISTASCVMLPDVILAGDLNIFRGDKVDGRIMSYLLNHVVNAKIARIAQGKSVVHVQASELCKLTLTYPDKNTQHAIIEFLSKLDDKITNEENALTFMSDLKEGMMQQLFI